MEMLQKKKATDVAVEQKELQKLWCCVWGVLSSEKPEKLGSDEQEFIITGSAQPELCVSYLDKSFSTAPTLCHKMCGMGVHRVALSADNTIIAAVDMAGTLSLLHVLEGMKWPSVSHTQLPNFWSTAFGPSRHFVYAGNGNGQVFKYGTEMGDLVHCYDTNQAENVLGLAVSADERFVAASSSDGYVTVFDAANGKIVRQMRFQKPMRSLSFDPSVRHLLAACDDKTVKIFDMPSGDLRECLLGHDMQVMAVDTAPNGQQFVTGSYDGRLKVWDARYMKCVVNFLSDKNVNLFDVAYNRLSDKAACVGEGGGLIIFEC